MPYLSPLQFKENCCGTGSTKQTARWSPELRRSGPPFGPEMSPRRWPFGNKVAGLQSSRGTRGRARKEGRTSCGLSLTANPTRPVVCSKTKRDSCRLQFPAPSTLRKSRATNPREEAGLHSAPGLPMPPAPSSLLPPRAEQTERPRPAPPPPDPPPAEPGGRRLTTPPPECSDLRPPHLLQQARHGSADGRARAALWEAPSGSLNPPPRPPLRHLGNSVAPPSQDLQGPACSQRENWRTRRGGTPASNPGRRQQGFVSVALPWVPVPSAADGGPKVEGNTPSNENSESCHSRNLHSALRLAKVVTSLPQCVCKMRVVVERCQWPLNCKG